MGSVGSVRLRTEGSLSSEGTYNVVSLCNTLYPLLN